MQMPGVSPSLEIWHILGSSVKGGALYLVSGCCHALLRRLASSFIYRVPAAISLMRYLLCSFMGSFAWGSAVFIGTFLLGINDTFALLSALSKRLNLPIKRPTFDPRFTQPVCTFPLLLFSRLRQRERQNNEKEWLSFQKTCLLKRRRGDLLFSNVRRKEGPWTGAGIQSLMSLRE